MITDSNGTTSMMRVGFLVCLIIGAFMCISGVIASFMSVTGAETMIVSGAGLMSTSGFAKSLQKRYEK